MNGTKNTTSLSILETEILEKEYFTFIFSQIETYFELRMLPSAQAKNKSRFS